MKKSCVFVFALAFAAVFAAAAVSAAISEQAIDDVIIPQLNHPAHFLLTLSGMGAGDYSLYSLTDVKLMPDEKFSVDGTASRDVYVYPTDALKIRGFYNFQYTLSKDSATIEEGSLMVKIVDLQDAIEIGSEANDPETGEVSFYVVNLEQANINNIQATFSSIFFNITETFDLKPGAIKDFTVKVNKEELKKVVAGSYIVKGMFKTNDGVQEIDGKIHIGERQGILVKEDTSGILARTSAISKTNVGNIVETVTTKVKKDIITRLFTSFNIEPNLVERSGLMVYYTWSRELKPTEVLDVRVTTSYFYPLLILIAAALLIMGFRRYTQTKIEVHKSVVPMRTGGGEFALKVRLVVKAKTRVESVSVVDRVPAVVKIYEKFPTTHMPRIDAANRRLQWDLGEMAPNEERHLAYVIYSKVGVVGKFSLPAALTVFEENGEVHEVESNTVFFLNEQAKRDD